MVKRHKYTNTFVEPDLPITPMLDMSFQLLAFFLMTFNPSPIEGHMDMALPKEMGDANSNVVPPPDPTKEEPEELTVQVDATDAGAIADIRLSSKNTSALSLGSDSAKLFSALQARRKDIGDKPAKVRLECGDNLSYKLLIKLMDEITRAGFKQVAPALQDDRKKK